MERASGSSLIQLIAPAVQVMGYELVGCEVQHQGRRTLIRVYIDSENGVMVADCERVSRQINAILEVEDPIMGSYELEVSSPGMDRPLYTLEHYQRFIGRKVRIRLRKPISERRNFEGILQAVTQEAITVEVDGAVWNLPFADIEKANLVPEF